MYGVLQSIHNISITADGIEFLDYLKTLSNDNYKAYKNDPSDRNELHKGYAIAIDSLITLFENSTDIIKVTELEEILKKDDELAQGHY